MLRSLRSRRLEAHKTVVRPSRRAQPQDEGLGDFDPAIARAVALSISWTLDAEKELKKIPFFVRGKARRNTESFAAERGLTPITVETLYEAKAHYGR
jgi:light-independent protochlorophyllide reductase subunit B